MKGKKRVCPICRQPFIPNPRTAKHQQVCSKTNCQKERKRRKWRRWACRNKEQKNLKMRLWAQAYPHYWRRYRRRSAEYRARDNLRRRLAAKKARRSAKQTLIRTVRVEKLRAIRKLASEAVCSAKQTPMLRLGTELVEYLWWRDCSAKHTHIALVTGSYG